MDEQLPDAICERLESSLSTKEAYIVRELESSTTDGGRTNFFSSITLQPGDFCGEELLTLGADAQPEPQLTAVRAHGAVRSVTEVEAAAARVPVLLPPVAELGRLLRAGRGRQRARARERRRD